MNRTLVEKKSMIKKMLLLGLIGSLPLSAFAKGNTWTGTISDSHCGATHNAAMQSDTSKKGKIKDRECTLACIKAGAKYVLVSQGKVYEIENQDFAGLQNFAGYAVKLTGEMNTNGKSIKVSNITPVIIVKAG
jgi:hypothetical protein